jgi:hypothetical protein
MAAPVQVEGTAPVEAFGRGLGRGMALIANAMSCDLEEYFQVQACEGVVARDQWAAQPSRLEPSTERVLALLDEAEAKATFFVLGWNAARHPELVRRIASDVYHPIDAHLIATTQRSNHFVSQRSFDLFDAHRIASLWRALWH